jgi:hypothetical protein
MNELNKSFAFFLKNCFTVYFVSQRTKQAAVVLTGKPKAFFKGFQTKIHLM